MTKRVKTEDNPAVVYLESLSPGSYWAVRHSLETVAAIVAGEGTDPWTFPWWELRYRDTARVRATLISRFAPSTVNRTLSALRSVLKHAWRLGLMDAETYRRAVDVENVRATTLPSGRAVEKRRAEGAFRRLRRGRLPGRAAGCGDAGRPLRRRSAARGAVPARPCGLRCEGLRAHRARREGAAAAGRLPQPRRLPIPAGVDQGAGR